MHELIGLILTLIEVIGADRLPCHSVEFHLIPDGDQLVNDDGVQNGRAGNDLAEHDLEIIHIF